MNILFTCAGRRNYLLKYFKSALDNKGLILAADMELSAPALQVADLKFVVPSIFSKDYIRVILEICRSNKVKALISLNDLELPILAANSRLFKKIGVRLLVSDFDIIDTCFDKWKTFKFCNDTNLPAPLTFVDKDEAMKAIKEGKLNFPLIIKPRWGSASIGIETVNNRRELPTVYNFVKRRIQNSILGKPEYTNRENSLLIQEKLIGTEYGVDILNDLKGTPVRVFVKEKLSMRAGETDRAVIRYEPDLIQIALKTGSSLKHIGNLDCDYIKKNETYYLLEMNPRFGGGYPFSHMAGANYPAAICSWLSGRKFEFDDRIRKSNTIFSKFDDIIEIRHFSKGYLPHSKDN